MAMSKDRVLFFLPRRYFLKEIPMTGRKVNGLFCKDCVRLLHQSFGVQLGAGIDHLYKLMEANPDGFYIRCRPSQFARFIVYRMKMLEATTEASNGVRNLQPIFEVDENPRAAVAQAVGIDASGGRRGISCLRLNIGRSL